MNPFYFSLNLKSSFIWFGTGISSLLITYFTSVHYKIVLC